METLRGLRQYIGTGDLVVIAVLVILTVGVSVVLWYPAVRAASDEASYVQVRSLDPRSGSQILVRVDLPAEEIHRLDGAYGHITVEVSGYRARVVTADCPDQVCVHTGWLGPVVNRSICVPNRLVLELMMEDEDRGIDEIIR